MKTPQDAADDWNDRHPPGTAVFRIDDFGKKHVTKTRSLAEVIGGHIAVVWTDDRVGCYDLSRIKAIV